MRIRKNAKISPLVYATSSLKPGTVIQTHVCQLNQSPWDVMSFSPPSSPPAPPPPPPPPPPSQFDGNDACGGNGSSFDAIPVFEREINAGLKREDSGGRTAAGKAKQPRKDETFVLCCKTDGKSWQCRREAAKGNSLCEHHLSLLKNYNSSSHSKKPEKSSLAEPQRRPRPKRAPASSSSNPHEFYYYSGFGPRWGRKRGEASKNVGTDAPKNVETENDLNSAVLSRFQEDEDMDYVEVEDDDDDEDEDHGESSRKKRARRPIKARSLKSLM